MKTTHELHQANRKGWNEGAEAYDAEVESDIAFLRGGGQNFCSPELPFLANLQGKSVIHLQCAGGRDTLSLWNLGAKNVVGVDISERMLACATRKSEALAAPAQWIHSDVLETPAELNGTADFVYTGRGALCWIMDLEAWAAVVYRLLKPGGKLYIFEGHPVSELWTLEDSGYVLDPEYGDYFRETPIGSEGWPSTYIGDLDKPAEEHATKYERLWRLGEIVNAVIGSGLVLERLEEHPNLFWDRFPHMAESEVRRLPQTFSLLARRPA